MVVREAPATIAAMHFPYASLPIVASMLYCTVQYNMEASDCNSIEPAIHGGVKKQVA
jgi:hypothetical protein